MHMPRLLVLASTYPARTGDGTPQFVRDLATVEALSYETTILVPSVPGGGRREGDGALVVRRFRYFPRRWEDLAEGRLLHDPQLCDQLGRAAATRAEGFSVDAICGRYVALLDEARTALLDEARTRKKGEASPLLATS
jgi:glycosyltransferase involved in cell wall biosynthesis